MNTPQDGQITNLRAGMSAEMIRHVCAEIGSHQALLPKEARQHLSQSLRKAVDGFRNPLKAPTQLVIPALTELATSSDPWLLWLVTQWGAIASSAIEESRKMLSEPVLAAIQDYGELAIAVRERLLETPLLDIQIAILCIRSGMFVQESPATDVEQTEPVTTASPEDPSSIMTSAADAAPPIKDTADSPPPDAVLPPPYGVWLETLSAKEPADSVWDSVTDFAARLTELSIAKLEARKSSARLKLKTALEQVYEARAAFSMPSEIPRNWVAADCAEQNIGNATGLAKQLHDAMLSQWALANEEPQSLKDREQWHHDCGVVFGEVHKLVTALNGFLLVEEAPVDPRPGIVKSVVVATKPEPPTAAEPAAIKPYESSLVVQPETVASVKSVVTIGPGPVAPAGPAPEVRPTAGVTGEPPRLAESVKGVLTGAPLSAEPEVDSPTSTSPLPEDSLKPAPTVKGDMRDSTSPRDMDVVVKGTEGTAAPAVKPAEAKSATHPTTALWNKIKNGDYSGAYWLAYTQEQLGRSCPMPSWLAAAMCGSMWLASGVAQVSTGLFEIANERSPIELDPVLKPLAIGCGLTVCLRSPEAGLQDWLIPITPPLESLNPVIEAVRRFAETGLGLTIEDMETTDSKASLEDDVVNAAADVRQWQNRVSTKKIRFQPATRVFRHLTRADGELVSLLLMAGQDKRDEADNLASSLQSRWTRHQDIEERIREVERAVMTRTSTRQIEGGAFKELVQEIEYGIALAKAWCAQCRKLRLRSQNTKGWLRSHVEDLRNQLKSAIPSAVGEARSLPSKTDAISQATAAYMEEVLNDLLSFTHGAASVKAVPPTAKDGLAYGLAYRLMLEPGLALKLSESGLPHLPPESLALAEERLLRDPAKVINLPEIVRDWTEIGDFRWVELIASSATTGERQEMLEGSSEALERRRLAVAAEVRTAEDRLEEATLQGAIGLDARSGFSARLENIRTMTQLSLPDFPDVANHLATLYRDIETMRDGVLREREVTWESTRAPLAALLQKPEMSRVEELVSDARARRDLFTLDEILSYARQAVNLRAADPVALLLESWKPTARKTRYYLEDFQKAREDLLRLLEDNKANLANIESDLRHDAPKAPAELSMTNLPKSRYLEVAQALLAWIRLKRQEGPKSQPLEDQEHIKTILFRYLGFVAVGGSATTASVDNHGRNWSLWLFPAKAPESPVQHYGSQISGKLRVLCVWERPGLDSIQTILAEQKLAHQPVLVLYLGRLLKRQWQDMVRKAQLEGLQSIVLDEVLLLYLAREYESRLQAFFHCALPSTAIIPYVPYVGGNVPREMFFGRRQQMKELRDPSGPSLIYGGRQLGKSSLLRQLEREFDDAARDKYSVLLEIKNIGAPGDFEQPANIWFRIMEALSQKYERLTRKPLTRNPESVRQKLSELFTGNKKGLVLLDEADNFLIADASNDFAVTNELKRLMDSTERRFRVVFAGLHNVQRFAHIPNQPLVHLGMPVLVGPLDPPDARELIERPLEALGFRVASEGAILRILSMTNYHPGLIQIFCYRLLEDLRKRAVPLPYRITDDDVEVIARNQQTREAIRERFIWTLALDDYYSVLVRAMVLDQGDIQGGYEKTYSLGDMAALGRDWWEAGFVSLSADEVRAYVTELRGLGILTNAGEGRFRLRSPNLVRLLGTRSTIEMELEDYFLGRRMPKAEWKDTDSVHPRIGGTTKIWSPLTQGQIRNLGILETESNVSIIFGSEATGLDRIPATLVSIRELMGPGRLDVSVSHNPVTEAKSLEHFIASRSRTAEKTVICVEAGGSSIMLKSIVESSLALVERASRSAALHVILMVGPETTRSWHELAPPDRERIEAQTGSTILRNWSQLSVKVWLESMAIPGTKENLEVAYASTGGFMFLLGALEEKMTVAKGHLDFGRIAREFSESLRAPGTDLGRRFLLSLNAGALREERGLFKRLCEIVSEKPEPLEDALALVEKKGSELAARNHIGVMNQLGWLTLTDGNISIEGVTRAILCNDD